MSVEKLLKIKEQIEAAKNKQAEIRGKIVSTQEQMQVRFKVKTVEEADQELKRRAFELDRMETEFEEGMKELEAAYPWGNEEK